VSYSGNTDEILILRYTSRWIKIHPTWSRHIDLDPSVSVAASNIVVHFLPILIVIDQAYISGDESRSDPARAKYCNHKNRDVATTSTP
jgi:hypothetical protein